MSTAVAPLAMREIIHIVTSLALIALILLQERSSGFSGVFGAGEGSFYQTRRGFERVLFAATIVLTAVFAGLSLSFLVF